jgi:hypothetical protein
MKTRRRKDDRFLGYSALMMASVRTLETPVYFNETTWRYIPEGSHFHTRRCENVKYHTEVTKFHYFRRYS